MSTRANRLLLALGVSAATHFWLLQGDRFEFSFERPPSTPALIEARLTPRPVARVAAPPVQAPTKRPQRERVEAPPAEPAADEIEVEQTLAPQTTETVAAAESTAAPEPPPEPAKAPPPPPTAKTPVLPRRIDIEFSVARSGGGSGIAHHVWQRIGENGYRISSTLEATGIASLFMHGKYIQTSQGTIGEAGLEPQLFIVERRNKIQSASFDRNANRMSFSDGQASVELPPNAQDLLSFAFQFAYNPPQRKSLDLLLTNGRKLGQYNYLVLDDEVLSTPVGSISTVHIHKLHEPDDDGLEMWLAPDLFYAPVKMTFVEKDGTRYELNITSIKIES